MTTDELTADLREKMGALLKTSGEVRIAEEARVSLLDDEIREAQTWAFRRAAYHERDRRCYRVGSAFEPGGGLDLDDVALTGLDCLGIRGVLLVAATARQHPNLPLNGILKKLFASEAGQQIRAWGAWRRWHWLSDLYRAETQTFLNSKKGKDPAQQWRSGKPTAAQEHIIREIARLLQIDRPAFARRGDAFEWIKAAGGNPRFHEPPPLPDLPEIGE
ncbi:hypothetical protein [Sphingobium sp. TKS]|uniref:hypothetical protein n=1 Tax=Sphingobium sp. TKS TaxID=1315974 RepID=UPI0007706670|nr:hypothetical protein [Sphingobium sp. TKS]AMK22078.1 hypothetical protein K426_05640 [Sphingobium sp. TKS]